MARILRNVVQIGLSLQWQPFKLAKSLLKGNEKSKKVVGHSAKYIFFKTQQVSDMYITLVVHNDPFLKKSDPEKDKRNFVVFRVTSLLPLLPLADNMESMSSWSGDFFEADVLLSGGAQVYLSIECDEEILTVLGSSDCDPEGFISGNWEW